MPDREAAVDVRGLVKRYGAIAAVDGVDLQIAPGQVYALLGPNGAGKTTLVEILEGYRSRDDGSVGVLGMDPQRQRDQLNRRVGIVLQRSVPMEGLTPRELLNFAAKLYDHPLEPQDAIDLVGLTDHADRRGTKLSGGQKRRLDLAMAVIGNPDLIFLDEPTTGFDASARRQAWDVVRGLTQRGATILLTTHYLDEAEHLADRIGIIKSGRLIFEGGIDDLRSRLHTATVVAWTPPDTVDRASLPVDWRTIVPDETGRLTRSTQEPTRLLAELIDWARSHDIDELPGLSVERPDLESMYLALLDASDTPPRAETAA